MSQPTTRRHLLRISGIAGSGMVLAQFGSSALAEDKETKKPEEDVSPAEDLMREHGVLKRVLLVYGEAIHRIDQNQDLPPDPLLDAAKLIRSFVEDYHEKLEENFLFPRFKKANTLVDLVDVLTAQHLAGRKLTDITIQYTNLKSLRDSDDRQKLKDSLQQFIRMYSPHEASEDTVLFPAFRKIGSGKRGNLDLSPKR